MPNRSVIEFMSCLPHGRLESLVRNLQDEWFVLRQPLPFESSVHDFNDHVRDGAEPKAEVFQGDHQFNDFLATNRIVCPSGKEGNAIGALEHYKPRQL